MTQAGTEEIAESGGDERWVSSVAGLQLSGSPCLRGKESPALLLLACCPWDDRGCCYLDSSISRQCQSPISDYCNTIR